MQRVVRSREAIRIDTDHFVLGGQHLALQIFPLVGGVGILFNNLTRQEELEHEVRSSRAIATAIAGHPSIATAQCDEDGRFFRVDEKFCRWIRFEIDAVLRARLVDLVVPSAKRSVVAALQDVVAKNRRRIRGCPVLGAQPGGKNPGVDAGPTCQR